MSLFSTASSFPALIFRHLREMLAAVQALFLSRDRKKNNRRRKLQLAQHSRAFQADGRSAAIVIRPGASPFTSNVSLLRES